MGGSDIVIHGKRGWGSWFLLSLVLVSVSACSYIGPSTVEGNRALYNTSIQQTDEEQMLLNLVRLKYRDTPFFMEVSSVSSQFVFNPKVTIGAPGTVGGSIVDLLNFGGGIDYQEKPTITYTPLRGEQFAKRMLSPISLDSLLLLYHSGWSIERIFRVALLRINDVRNAPSASGPTPKIAPEYKDFQKVAEVFRELQRRDALDMGYETTKTGDQLVMHLDYSRLGRQQKNKLSSLLSLDPNGKRISISTELIRGANNHLTLIPRSLMGVLFYLSQGVEVSKEDEDLGLVTMTQNTDGSVFDWGEVVGDLIRVVSSKEKPFGTSVAVEYRGVWFYINDSDLESKSTFSLLSQLVALQSGEARTRPPVYTIQ